MLLIIPVFVVLLIGTASASYAEFPSPLKQIQDGTDPADIQCNDGRVHVVRDDGRHACIKETTAERFGWEIVPAKILADDDVKPVGQDTPMMPALNQTGDAPPIPASVASANNEFAVDFYKQVISGEKHRDKNIFFSPTSMYTAFSMLYEGARNDTAQQIQDVFGFEPDVEIRHDMISDTISSLNRDDPLATLALANSAWTANWFTPYEPYMDTVRDTYIADIESVDFLSDGVDKINQWASDNTNKKIEVILTSDDVDESTAMILANAIYFNGTWVTKFSPFTQKHEFHIDSTQRTMIDFMYMQANLNYAVHGDIQAISLPYEGDRLSMMVILPNDTSGVASMEAGDGDTVLSADLVQKLREDMEYTAVDVYLPAFTMKTNYDLIEPLQTLGITDAFNKTDADLSGIADPDKLSENLYISDAMQSAFINVTMDGTEASASTGLAINRESLMPTQAVFMADHPFLFLILDDESGAILFMGKMMNPE